MCYVFTIGIPSPPTVVNFTTTSTSITFTLQCQYTGILINESEFYFIVIVYDAYDGEKVLEEIFQVSDYTSGMNYIAIIDELLAGVVYNMSLITRNTYGSSKITTINSIVLPAIIPTVYSNSLLTSSQSSSMSLISSSTSVTPSLSPSPSQSLSPSLSIPKITNKQGEYKAKTVT